MSKELDAFERIKDDLEYVTRLDYVSPIVRGEVRDELYKIYHRELPDLEIIETALNRLEKLEEILKIIKEKGINTFCLENTDNSDEYKELTKSHLGMKRLTETEFNLLKEYFK